MEAIDDLNNEAQLLPGLPNHLAQICLSTLRPSLLSSVCRSWRRHLYSPSFPPFLTLYAVVANNRRPDFVEFFSFDPISAKWTSLPSPATAPPLRLLHRHPSFISRNLTVQSLSVTGHLVVISGTGQDFLPAISRPLIFDPLTKNWFFGPPVTNPRRWCIAGTLDGTVYVASGIGSRYGTDVARMVEKWDMKKKREDWKWEEREGLKDGRFCREAIDAVGYKGKLCMVNVKGNAVKEGVVYDVERNRWEKMAAGMLLGWSGVVGVAAAVEEEEEEEVMYVVDEEKGGLSKYDNENDCWEEIIEKSEELKGAEQMAVSGGKICVVCGGGGWITVVDVMEKPARIFVVKPPPETLVISVHILSRMSLQEN